MGEILVIVRLFVLKQLRLCKVKVIIGSPILCCQLLEVGVVVKIRLVAHDIQRGLGRTDEQKARAVLLTELQHGGQLLNVLRAKVVGVLAPGVHRADSVKVDDRGILRLGMGRTEKFAQIMAAMGSAFFTRRQTIQYGIPFLLDRRGPVGGPAAALPGKKRIQGICTCKVITAGHVAQQVSGLILPGIRLQLCI